MKFYKDTTKQARTWFAKISARDRAVLIEELSRIQSEICEHSVLDDVVWRTAIEKDRKFWGSGKYFGDWQPTNMIAILAGLIKKLHTGGDPTDAQVDHINKIFEVTEAMSKEKSWRSGFHKITLEEESSSSQSAVERLRSRLFEHE